MGSFYSWEILLYKLVIKISLVALVTWWITMTQPQKIRFHLLEIIGLR